MAVSCARPPPVAPAPQSRPRIEAFTDPSPVVAIAFSGPTLATGSAQGIDLWDPGSGEHRRLGPAQGISGGVRALAVDRPGSLWFAAGAGVGRVDLASERVEMMPPPPATMSGALATLRALAPDPNGGVWAGAGSGLVHIDAGGWHPTAMRREVLCLRGVAGGALWLGTREGVVERNLGGVFTPLRDGSTLANVTALAEGPDGAPVAIGEDGAGQPRLAVQQGGALSTYRLAGDARVLGAARGERGLILATTAGLLALVPPGARPAGAGRPALLHVAGKRSRPPYAVAVLDAAATDVTAVAAGGGAVYLGTRGLGTTRIAGGGPQASSHLRTRELVAGARTLTVACAGAGGGDCFIATGGSAFWRFDGRAFSRVAIEPRPIITLAVVRSPKGEVLALYREPSAREVHVARFHAGGFTRIADLKVETPSGATVLSFARFAPDGLLWLGLAYVDADGDARPYGAALVDVELAAVSYHREADKKPGVLPVPNDVVDVAFSGDETWFASGSGVARLSGEELRVWNEADALKSEILHGIVAAPGGRIFVASSSGVGQFDGTRWSYPPPLSLITNALARGAGGELWLGTERGLVRWDGARATRFDRAAGLLDDRVFDVAVDSTGRVWARGADGLSLLTP